MTVTAATTNVDVPLLPASQPSRPPTPELDDLDGYLNAYLAQSVKPHRERLVDILSVIDATPSGQTLLGYFQDRARQNHALVVNLLAAGSPLPDGAAAQDLWLNEADLTAGAEQIGVPPEVQYAPSVFQSMVLARNASLAQQYLDHAKHHPDQASQAPADLQARFQQELAAQRSTAPVTLDRAQTFQMVQAQSVATAMAELQINRDLRRVPIDPKPGDAVPTLQSQGRRVTLPAEQDGGFPSGVVETIEKQPIPRRESAPSLSGSNGAANSPGAAQAPVIASLVPVSPGAPGAGPSEGAIVGAEAGPTADPATLDAASTSKPKNARRRLTQWVNKRFQGFTDALARIRRQSEQAGRSDIVPQASANRSNSASSSGSKPADNTVENATV